MTNTETPQIIEIAPNLVTVSGCWHVHAFTHADVMQQVTTRLAALTERDCLQWNLSAVSAIDHLGAQILWNSWHRKRPAQLILLPTQEVFFRRLELANTLAIPASSKDSLGSVVQLGEMVLGFFRHGYAFTMLLGQLMLDLLRVLSNPRRGPWKELVANIYQMGFCALGITALVGVLIGVVLSYLSAQQLRTFGGDIYLVNILGMSVIRELGPMLTAILVAGRSGSAITAQLGVMRVTEELDAMQVMGISQGMRIILPKVLALAFVMPLLVVWTDAMALIGGMVSANYILGMSPAFFLQKLPEVVALPNYYIGLGKGVVFGAAIALVACHFGLLIKPNTESLGQGTTTAVVSAITMVIVLDAVFAIVFTNVGYF